MFEARRKREMQKMEQEVNASHQKKASAVIPKNADLNGVTNSVPAYKKQLLTKLQKPKRSVDDIMNGNGRNSALA